MSFSNFGNGGARRSCSASSRVVVVPVVVVAAAVAVSVVDVGVPEPAGRVVAGDSSYCCRCCRCGGNNTPLNPKP